ncbi:MAG: sulfite exporter TauE/SafE family protein [Uliginosibacterium sp.]|nr:sulfite exporter TauE/SafE family protein [Uliginosibacterium sp.]
MLLHYSVGAWSVAIAAVLLTGISKSGFGGALGGVAVPLLSLFMPPPLAAAAILPSLCIMDACGLRAYWGKWSWQELRIILPGGLVGIVIGSLVFRSLSTQALILIVGGIALICALDHLFGLRKRWVADTDPGPVAGFAWSAAAGLVGALAHAGGPLLLIYLLRRRLSKESFVATSVVYFAAMNIAKIGPYFALDLFTAQVLQLSALLAVLAPIGVWLGYTAQRLLPEVPFFRAATLLLGLTGIKLMVDAFFA